MGKLEGKIALITGGNSGIGRACCELFAQEGANVLILGRNIDKSNELKKYLISKNGKADVLKCDITSVEDIESVATYVKNKYGKLDILINNAGVFITNKLLDITDDDWKKTFDTNITGCFHLTKIFMNMLENSNGVVVNNSSVAGMGSYIKGNNYMYGAAKAAVIQFSKYCALNYAGKVRVNCVCPGIIDTPIFENRDFSRFDSVIPMKRMGKPEDVAKAVLFLASDESSYITGAVLPVDGGVSL